MNAPHRPLPLPLLLLGLLLAAQPAYAATKAKATASPVVPAATAPSDMIDISAEESLEFYKDTQLYVARGKAKAVRGEMTVEADLLTAHQRATKGEASQNKTGQQASGSIDQLTAEGNVHIYDPKQQAFGERAVYDMDRKAFKMTGSNLKYMTAKDIVTAKDSLEYDENSKVALARGHAIGEHQDSRVEADLLTAQFAANEQGQMEMTQMTAKGNVMIVTKDGGISRGDRGFYDVKKNVAYLYDHVRITRGETQLAGDKAEVDFTSGQSHLLNSGSGRVRALLPSSGSKQPDVKTKTGAP